MYRIDKNKEPLCINQHGVVLLCLLMMLFFKPTVSAQICRSGFIESLIGSTSSTVTDADYILEGNVEITDPQDPNEIVGPAGYDSVGAMNLKRWVSAEQRMSYTIYFENDADSATATAIRVEVRLKIPEYADITSVELGEYGFSNTTFPVTGSLVNHQKRLNLRNTMGIDVAVIAGIDVVRNEVFWIFEAIDTLTGLPPIGSMEGFLPINDSTHRGEGFVTFSVIPNTHICHTGDTIPMVASIIFDVNNAIATNTWVNTIDAVAPTSTIEVTPNATFDSILVAFAGQDDAGGCGVKQYRLYCSMNRGGYQPIGVFTGDSIAAVPIEAGVQYSFLSLAEDNVGNIEPMKSDGDTIIGVNQVPIYALPMPENGGVIAGAGVVEQGDSVLLTATANEGYHFVRWAEQGVTVENDVQYSFVAEQSRTLTAMFERDAYHLWVQNADGATVTVTDNGGNAVLSGATILHGDTLNLAVQSSSCFSLDGLTVNGQSALQTTSWIVGGDVTIVPTTTPVAVDTLFYTDAVCVGDDYSGYGFNILSSATSTVDTLVFTAQVQNEAGCYGTAQLTLIVKPYITITFDANGGTGTMEPQTICANELGLLSESGYQGASATLQSNVFTKSGGENFEGWALSPTGSVTYTDGDVITTSTDLTLYAQWTSNCVNAYATELQRVCDSFAWRGNTYTISDIYSDTITGAAAGGCDSIYTLHLTVNNSSHITDTVIACDSYVWIDDQRYDADNNSQTYVMPNISGCDSVITLALTIHHSDTVFDHQNVCNSLIWIDGRTYNESNHSAFVKFQNADGCDSIVRLDLDVLPRWNVSFNSNGGVGNMPAQRLCSDEPGVLNSNLFTREGYQFDGWSLLPDEEVQYQDNDTITVIDNVILYAKWLSNCHDVHSTIRTTICDRYVWGEKVYTETGLYNDTVTGVVPGMCDSIYTFDLTVKHKTFSTDTRTECPGYEWMNGREYYEDNSTSIYRLTNSMGCDSLITLNLTILPERTVTFMANGGQGTMTEQTVCSGNNVLLQGNQFVREGYYFAGWAMSDSSDMVYTDGDVINLTSDVTLYAIWSTTCVPNYSTDLVSACDTYQWRGVNLLSSGLYRDTVASENAQTCDSIYVLHLTLNASSSTIETRVACESFVWWDGHQYTENTTTPTYTMTTREGCDSTLTLHLTINHSTNGIETMTACDSYTWNGTTYSESSTATYLTTNAAGCDSTVTLNLTINHSTNGTETVTACDSFTWNGTTYAESSTATYLTTNVAGCDSTVTLYLTINHSTNSTETITACDSYTWNGTTYTESDIATYQTTNAAGCDSLVTLNLTINHSAATYDTLTISSDLLPYDFNGISINHEGDYTLALTTAEGCDSTVYLNVQVTTGIDDVASLNDIKIYPNPTNGKVTIVADKVLNVDVLDIVGRKVTTFDNTDTIDISMLSEGSYILRITTSHGVAVRKIVKK